MYLIVDTCYFTKEAFQQFNLQISELIFLKLFHFLNVSLFQDEVTDLILVIKDFENLEELLLNNINLCYNSVVFFTEFLSSPPC